MRPRLSVVVVCINNLDALHRCLAALVPQLSPGQVELLAVGHWGDRGNASARFSEVCWVSAPAAATVPQMRAQGLKESRGDIVALLEDDCVVGDGWCGAVIRAHGRH